ncbi:MAG: LLM class flavin-dependent oxidoreductase [Candidatus Binataceae bacterium]|jgi:alkanesulfonate monooxygenase SsuD/methylene tetrahydromethanopterin reductase-like flavin-dependent oxidoreductase (luciferase family)
MDFGITIAPHIDRWDLIRYAEDLGFDRAWVPDSQMLWSDCYAILALAAVNTRRIKIGTGVSIAGTRIAPVTAHSIGSINQLAPGRVFLGVGTGHTAMRVMGQEPMPTKEFREYLRVVRTLLDGDAVDYTYRGRTREIKFIHRDRYFVNLDNRIPIYVAANGPKACQAAGAYADGWVTIGRDAKEINDRMTQIKTGAQAVGRNLGNDFHTVLFTVTSVLRPGEKLTSERVINEVGSWVTCELHFFYEIWNKLGRKDEMIPPHFVPIWGDYLKRVEGFSLPEKSRFRQIHEGHATFVPPEERRFVTPDAIRASVIVGSPEEIIEQIRGLEKNGIKEINIMPGPDYARPAFRDFAEMIMPAFKR